LPEIDDPARAPVGHPADERLRDEKRAGRILRDQPVPERPFGLEERHRLRGSGVVDDRVDAAESHDGFIAEAFHFAFPRHVARHGENVRRR
jgi:hypothetical protein